MSDILTLVGSTAVRFREMLASLTLRGRSPLTGNSSADAKAVAVRYGGGDATSPFRGLYDQSHRTVDEAGRTESY